MFVCLCMSESVHSFMITCVFATVQIRHKGNFSEKDKIGVGPLFLYPEVVFTAASNGMHVCLLDCGAFFFACLKMKFCFRGKKIFFFLSFAGRSSTECTT